jgi:hypothetical protein
MNPRRFSPTARRALASFVAALVVTAAPSRGDSPASKLYAAGDFTKAAAAYAAALDANPHDLDAELKLGALRLYANDITDAEPLLEDVVAAQPANAEASRLLGEARRRRAEADRRTTVGGAFSVVPFVRSAPLPVVRVMANGTAANFIVDTGASVALEPEFATRIGVKIQTAGVGHFAGGKQAPISRGSLASLALGSATAYDVPVIVHATHAGELFGGKLHIDGIVGTTFFERFLATIDYSHARLVLRPRSKQVSAAFESAAQSAGAAVVPCWLVGDHFVFARAQVNGAAPGLFVFDSGLAGAGLMPTKALVDAAHVKFDERGAGSGIGGGGAVKFIPFVARSIAVGTAVQHDIPGSYTPEGTPFGIFPFTVWGAISGDFLKHYAYTVDFDAMKLVLQPK